MRDMHATIWTYPWDLADERFETVAHNLAGEIGLNGMSLASAYHTFEMLRPRSRGKVLLQIPRSAVYFQPREEFYGDTPIRPLVSPLMGSADWYAEASSRSASWMRSNSEIHVDA